MNENKQNMSLEDLCWKSGIPAILQQAEELKSWVPEPSQAQWKYTPTQQDQL